MDNNTIPSQIPENPPLSVQDKQKIIEAILFAAGHPVSYGKLADVLGESPTSVQKTVENYARIYNAPDSPIPRGIMMLTFENSCQLCTVEQYGQYIREALGIRRGGNLSASSIEILSIVAYNEPVTRAYIDTVRGVDSSYGINSLCEKHLLEACGRLDAPGRPLLYRTTPDFLRVFGLQSLNDLPPINLPQKSTEDPAPTNPPPSEASFPDTEQITLTPDM